MVKAKPFAAKRYKYAVSSKGVSNYLAMVNKRQGIVKDNMTKAILQHQGFVFDDDTMAQSKYEPDALFDALFAYDQKHIFKPNGKLFNEAIRKVHNHFHALKNSLIPAHHDEVLRTLKWSASAGAPYFTSKKEAMKDWRYDPSKAGKDPCVAYYRTQARQTDEGEWRQKVRLVWGYPLDTTITEGRYARPIIEKLVSSQQPYVLGLTNREIGARLNYISWKPYTGTFDWSGFDTTVSEKLIRSAFAIIRTFFKEGSIDETEWNNLINYFIFTPILMPDGRVYFGKTGGIPSGSYFTGIIGSVVNLLLIEYLCLEQGVDVYQDNILVMGDDSVIGLSQKLDLARMSRVASQHFGMKLHREKQRFNRDSKVLDFLSHSWKGGRCFRPVTVSTVKLVYSERSWNTKELRPDQIRLARLFASYKDNHKMWPVVRKALLELGVDHITDRVIPVLEFEHVYSNQDKTGEFKGRASIRTESRVIMSI